jgi:hypothetical protein
LPAPMVSAAKVDQIKTAPAPMSVLAFIVTFRFF